MPTTTHGLRKQNRPLVVVVDDSLTPSVLAEHMLALAFLSRDISQRLRAVHALDAMGEVASYNGLHSQYVTTQDKIAGGKISPIALGTIHDEHYHRSLHEQLQVLSRCLSDCQLVKEFYDQVVDDDTAFVSKTRRAVVEPWATRARQLLNRARKQAEVVAGYWAWWEAKHTKPHEYFGAVVTA
jgi:hypothetical protein